MVILTFAVVAVGALCLLDLLLTFGVVRRLREHTESLALLGNTGSLPLPPPIEVGTEIGSFSATTLQGEAIFHDQIPQEILVAFLAPNCQPCKETLPKLISYSRNAKLGKHHLLAVVVGDHNDPETQLYADDLSPVAQVVVEGYEGGLGTAFKVNSFPALLRVAPLSSGGLVVVSNQVDLDAVTQRS